MKIESDENRDKMGTLKVYLLVGGPGSGKSTFGKNLEKNALNIVRVCPDEFRAKIGWGEADQSVSAEAFAATKVAMELALQEGKDVIVDATNMYKKSRKQFLDIARKHGAYTTAFVFEVDKKTLLERNINRGKEGGRNVPENVIDSMLSKYERPEKPEFDIVIKKS